MHSSRRKKEAKKGGTELAEEEETRQVEMTRRQRSELSTPPIGEHPAALQSRLDDLISKSSEQTPVVTTLSPPTVGADTSLLALVSVMQQQMQMQQQQWQEAQRERQEEIERRRVEEAERERQQQIRLKELETNLAKMTTNLEDMRLEEQREARMAAKQERERQEVQQELKEKAKAIPLPRAMKEDTDVQDFLETYELTQKKRLIAEKNWATHLLPLLNDNCMAIAHSLSPTDKDNYDTLKQALLKAHSCSNKQAAQQMWEMRKPKDITYRAWASKVKRAVLKSAPEGDFNALVDSIATEKFIRSLPRDAAVFVRNSDPAKLEEAADMATRFTSNSAEAGSHAYKEYSAAQSGGPRQTQQGYQFRQYSKRPYVKKDGGKDDQGRPQGSLPTADKTKDTDPKDATPDKNNNERRPLICHNCGGRDHYMRECPSRPRGVNRIVQGHAPEEVMPGSINGKPLKDLLVDTGSAVTIVARDVLGRRFKAGPPLVLEGFGGQGVTYPTSKVTLTIEGTSYQMKVAVAARSTLKGKSALLGRDIPGMRWAPVLQPRLPEEKERHEDKMETDPERRLPEEEKQDEKSALQTLQPEYPQQPAQVKVVQTRAQARREASLREEEDRQSQESGAVLTNLQGNSVLTNLQDTQKKEETDVPDSDEEEEQQLWIQELPLEYPLYEEKQELQDIPLSAAEFTQQQKDDQKVTVLWESAKQGMDSLKIIDGTLYKQVQDELGRQKNLLVVPTNLRRRVWETAHSHPLAGHLGHKKTRRKVAQNFYWPEMAKDVLVWTKTCVVCQKGNVARRHKAPMQIMPILDRPWQRIAIDLVQPLPGKTRTKKGNRFILTCMDFTTRYPEAFPLRRATADAIAEKLLELFSRFGVPDEILSDNGPNLTGSLMTELFQLLDIKHIKTTPYRPQTNGMLERWHRTLKTMLSKLTNQGQQDWDKWLPFVLFASRDSPHAATGFSPFELLFGREVRGPSVALRELWTAGKKVPKSVADFVLETKQAIKESIKIANQREKKAKEASKNSFDKGSCEDPLEVGQEVLALLPAGGRGVSASWEGPFTILAKPTPVTYQITATTRRKPGRVVHRNLLKRFAHPVQAISVVVADESEDLDQLPLQEFPSKEDENIDHTECVKTDILNNNNISKEQQEELISLVEEFSDVFSTQPGLTNLVEFGIDTGDSRPVSSHPYTVPLKWKSKYKEALRDMLDAGLLVPSQSPWASPAHCVPKPDGSLRLVGDYRRLNQKTVGDTFPLPRINTLLEEVATAKWITTLDMTKGYLQVPVRKQDQPKTALITELGKFEFTRMPFGLKNAPACFQRMVNDLLMDIPDADGYIDDLVIHSATWQDHIRTLRKVLEKLAIVGLTVKPIKTKMARKEVQFLGHTIGGGLTRTQDCKVQAIREFQEPKSKKDLRRFLGMVGYYRRFIPDFGSIAAPLHQLTAGNKNGSIEWQPHHQTAFELLKTKLTEAPVLISPDLEKDYIVQTDASDVGIGGVLAQLHEGQEKPVAYFSRRLKPAEKNYTVSEKECLAVVETVKSFAVYLLGAHFKLVTDHAALKALNKTIGAGARIARWALALQAYDFTVKHKPGAQHTNADALSRQSWTWEEEQGPREDCEEILSGEKGSRPEDGIHLKEGGVLGSPPNNRV